MADSDPDLPETWPESAHERAGRQKRTRARGTDTPLGQTLAARIRTTGPITFAEFMEAALYDPEAGYYRTGRPVCGREGDSPTSPETHPLFGGLIARWLVRRAAAAGWSSLEVVEAGAGSGALAAGILDHCADSLPVTYRIVEPVDANRVAQRERLAAHEGSAHWLRGLSEIASGTLRGVVLSNELVGAFPVHRVVARNGRLHELRVTVEDGRFVETPGPLSTPWLNEYFRRLGGLPGEGRVVEANLRMLDWLGAVARVLGEGWVLTLDYGGTAAELYGAQGRGSALRSWRSHARCAVPLEAPGLQDLTCGVDFTSLMYEGRRRGLEPEEFTDQRSFLRTLGFDEERDRLLHEPQSTGRRHVAAVDALVDPDGLGRTRVLIQATA